MWAYNFTIDGGEIGDINVWDEVIVAWIQWRGVPDTATHLVPYEHKTALSVKVY
jgi:hypothetical protein